MEKWNFSLKFFLLFWNLVFSDRAVIFVHFSVQTIEYTYGNEKKILKGRLRIGTQNCGKNYMFL